MFMFERSLEPFSLGKRSREPFWHHVYVRAKSRTLTPCLCSSEVENPALLVYVRAESRTFLTPCLYSSGVENLPDTLFIFERSREPWATWHLVYVRAESRTLFMFEPSWHHVYVRAESRTLFMFERSREPCATWLLVHVRAESRTLLYFTPCLCSSGVENLFIRQAESRTLFRIVP